MGYLSIENLYKNQDVIAKVDEWWALEKIHGTSTRIVLRKDSIRFVSGGAKHQQFVKLFDEKKLTEERDDIFKEIKEIKDIKEIIIYGEAYGGKLLKMAETYGSRMKFIVFEVSFDDNWLKVPEAHKIAMKLGLEFVSYKKIPSTIEALNKARDEDSELATRNGFSGKIREGIVIRAVCGNYSDNCNHSDNSDNSSIFEKGERLIFKHKRPEFSEHKYPQELNVLDEKNIRLAQQIKTISENWVTPMRLEHILDKLKSQDINHIHCDRDNDIAADHDNISYPIPVVIEAMLNDVKKESVGEIEFTPEISRQILKDASKLYRKFLNSLDQEIPFE